MGIFIAAIIIGLVVYAMLKAKDCLGELDDLDEEKHIDTDAK